MFSSLLVAFSLTNFALATPVPSNLDALTVKLTPASNDIQRLEDLNVTAEITNTGNKDIKALTYSSIFDKDLPTQSFRVTKDGQEVPFTGVRLTISFDDVDESGFTIIPAGKSVNLTHQLGSLFDFESLGAGSYDFAPVNKFHHFPSSDLPVRAANFRRAITSSIDSVRINISGDLGKRQHPELQERAVDICANGTRKDFIDATYTEAKQLASVAAAYVTANGNDAVFNPYYKLPNNTAIVAKVLNAVANENGNRTLDCSDSRGICTGGVLAYTVVPSTNIHFCNLFFSQVPTTNLCSGTSVAARNIRGGTLLHEFTHALTGTGDYSYGCANDQALPQYTAIRNADTYNCFATQVYQNTKCNTNTVNTTTPETPVVNSTAPSTPKTNTSTPLTPVANTTITTVPKVNTTTTKL